MKYKDFTVYSLKFPYLNTFQMVKKLPVIIHVFYKCIASLTCYLVSLGLWGARYWSYTLIHMNLQLSYMCQRLEF